MNKRSHQVRCWSPGAAGRFRPTCHLGFHHPRDWLSGEADERSTAHVRVISEGISEILRLMPDLGTSSVAFPLIGCGLFGLDPALMTQAFYDSLMRSQLSNRSGPWEVWLVVQTRDHERQAVQALLSLIQSQMPMPGASHGAAFLLGLPFVDDFAQTICEERHPQWRG